MAAAMGNAAFSGALARDLKRFRPTAPPGAITAARSSAARTPSSRLARTPEDLGKAIKEAEAELGAIKETVKDLIEEETGSPVGRASAGQLEDRLRGIARKGGPNAQRAKDAADAVREVRKKIGELHKRRGTAGTPAPRGPSTDERRRQAEERNRQRRAAGEPRPRRPWRPGPNNKPRPPWWMDSKTPTPAPTPPATTKTPPATAETPPATGGRGGSVAPIQVPEPAARGASAKAAHEGAAIALVSTQLNNMRAREMQKAVDRLQALGPEIDKQRSAGNDVIVTLRVEIPDQVDIAAIWAGIGDASQVVYFSEMRISAVMKRRPAANDPLTRGSPDKAPNDQMHGRGDAGPERKPWYLEHPKHKGFHFATGDLLLPGVDLVDKDAGPRIRFRTTELRSVAFGSKRDVSLHGLHRTWIWGAGGGIFDDCAPQDPWKMTEATGLAELVTGGGRVRMERGAGPVEVITSAFRAEPSKSGKSPLLIESAEGKPLGSKDQYAWKAEIAWTKID